MASNLEFKIRNMLRELGWHDDIIDNYLKEEHRANSWKYVVVERYYDDGTTSACIISRENFKKSDYPCNPRLYDQYFTKCLSQVEALNEREEVLKLNSYSTSNALLNVNLLI